LRSAKVRIFRIYGKVICGYRFQVTSFRLQAMNCYKFRLPVTGTT
jgi:hypothetical protein